jgi:dTDP-D-glucose 4,6-dehydratase
MKLLVCGGAGFIGSNFARLRAAGGDEVVVLDKLTYAGRPENLWTSSTPSCTARSRIPRRPRRRWRASTRW